MSNAIGYLFTRAELVTLAQWLELSLPICIDVGNPDIKQMQLAAQQLALDGLCIKDEQTMAIDSLVAFILTQLAESVGHATVQADARICHLFETKKFFIFVEERPEDPLRLVPIQALAEGATLLMEFSTPSQPIIVEGSLNIPNPADNLLGTWSEHICEYRYSVYKGGTATYEHNHCGDTTAGQQPDV